MTIFIEKKNMFEKFLQEVHARDYHGTDDDMPDAFDAWVSELEVDGVIKYAEESLTQQLDELKGKVEGMEKELIADKAWKNLSVLEVWKEGIKTGINKTISNILTLIDSMK